MIQFIAFLNSILTDQQTVDNLRLPLQSALFISPIFLLGENQIHTSKFYHQHHKLVLVRNFLISRLYLIFLTIIQYSKCLGNERPTEILKLERVIWHEIFQIARGFQTVYDAAANIIKSLPDSFDHIDPNIRKWFIVGMEIFAVLLNFQ